MIWIEPEFGTPLTYHGSKEDFHGPATYIALCECRRCAGFGPRHRIAHAMTGEELHCVRSESISLVNEDAAPFAE